MTPAQRADAELLKSLGRPADAIAANTGLDLPTIKTWLRSGRWPKSSSTQRQLFDAGPTSRETTKPSSAEDGRGLSLFSNPAGRPGTSSHSGRSE